MELFQGCDSYLVLSELNMFSLLNHAKIYYTICYGINILIVEEAVKVI